MSAIRRPVLFREAKTNHEPRDNNSGPVQKFHKSLAGYKATKLHALPAVAEDLGLKQVYIKDESSRFTLPSFKILGASWGTFTALTDLLELPLNVSVETLTTESAKRDVKLFAATDGNHGRAVAYMAKLLSIEAYVYVPATLHEHVKRHIADEGAHIIEFAGNYDGAVEAAAKRANETHNGVLVQDTSFPGYTTIPTAIVEGYSTMFHEIDEELDRKQVQPQLVITPVGVGSLAHAVVRHYSYKSENAPKVMTVEPDTSACLYESLKAKESKTVSTSYTIMTGMDCGTPSTEAWQDLSDHVSASSTVSDFEAHQAVQILRDHGVASGPCGAAGLAALRRLGPSDRATLGLGSDSVVVLLNTEGHRAYNIPLDVSTDDPVELTSILTQIESTNPTLSTSGGTGESMIADYIEAWLRHRGFESYRFESTSGRPSVMGAVRGSGNGKNLMLNGHVDTVNISSYLSKPLSGDIVFKDGVQVVLGRGSADMKAGLAINMTALSTAAALNLSGDVVLAAVADEEDRSLGTEDILRAGWHFDGAIVTEPTMMALGTGHKGFVWLEVEILGFAAHGSQAELGVDAIMNAGSFLTALKEYSHSLPVDDYLGQASLHCGFIEGGQELSTYPASCTIRVEFRTIPEQKTEAILTDISRMLSEISENDEKFRYREPQVLFQRAAYKLESNHPFEHLAVRAASLASGRTVQPEGMRFWCDAALLAEAGIPTVVYGPCGYGLHADEEWVEVESIRSVKKMVVSAMKELCG